MSCFIYALKCPKKKKIRYIGKSINPQKRYVQHIKYHLKGDSHKKRWIKSLLRDGLKPILMILEECTSDNWQEREQYWISFYRGNGHPLTNTTEGGDAFGPIPLDVEAGRRDRIRAARTGMLFTDEHRQSLSDAAKAKFQSKPDLREKLRKASSTLDDEHVLEIYRLACEGAETFSTIGKRFGVSGSTVSEIFNGSKHSLLTGATRKINPQIQKKYERIDLFVRLYKSEVSVEELATRFDISPDTVRRILKKGLGMGVAQYETMKRKQVASKMYAEGKSFEEIGEIIGMKAMSVWALLNRTKKYERI